ncbi:hypothetical protein [Isoalcanivorax beigongshangi]|uniref:DUF721 domain-containing protein n=1 Tax=Isoalcanivorax beigongshangi TaxID=3238810 RepID=A0ABV4ALP0_9GAMM
MSKAIGPASISLFFSRHQNLRQIKDRAHRFDEPAATPVLSLPPALSARTHALIEDGVLLLLAENNAVAQMLRFHAPRLAREQGAQEWKVRVARIETPRPLPAAEATVERVLSADAASMLSATADAVSDPDLSAALRRLASRASQ